MDNKKQKALDKFKENWKKIRDNEAIGGGEEPSLDMTYEILDAFQAAMTNRQNSCYHTYNGGDTTGNVSNSNGGSNDWMNWWDKQLKMYIKWQAATSVDNPQSNVKLATTTGRVNAFVAQIMRLNLAWTARAARNKEEYRYFADVWAALLKQWYEENTVDEQLGLAFTEAAIHGTGIYRLNFIKEYKNVRVRDKAAYKKKKGKKNEGKELGEKVDKEEGYEEGKKFEKVKIEDYDMKLKDETICTRADMTLHQVPLKDFYVNPTAQSIHGVNHGATQCFWVRYMSMQEFQNTYSGQPGVKNLDKVKPINAMNYISDWSFFTKDSTTDGDAEVMVIEFEGLAGDYHDNYCVIANDVMIIESVLPEDKQFSFYMARFLPMPGEFYGIGIADLVMSEQTAAESLLNLAIDFMYRSVIKRYFVSKQMQGDIEGGITRIDEEVVYVDDATKPINQMVQEIVPSSVPYDLFNMLNILEANATKSSQIDPQQIGLASGTTATESMLNKEQFDVIIQAVVDRYMDSDAKAAGRHLASGMKQHYSTMLIADSFPETNKLPTVKLENQQVVIEDDNKKYITSSDGDDYVDIDEDILNAVQNLEVFIAPDQVEVMSKALERKEAQEMLAQMYPISANPNNPDSMQMNPNAVFNSVEIARFYQEKMNLPESTLLERKQPFREEDMEEAKDHIDRILNGEDVPGEPGRSDMHRYVEAYVLRMLEQERDKMIEDFEKNAEKLMDQLPDEAFMEGALPAPEMSPNEKATLDRMQETIDRLARHLDEDNTPSDLVDEKAMEMAVMPEMSGSASVQPAQGQMPDVPMPTQGGIAPQGGIEMPPEALPPMI